MAAAVVCWGLLAMAMVDVFGAIGQLRAAASQGAVVETTTRSAAPTARATAADGPLAGIGEPQAPPAAMAPALPHLAPEALLRAACLRALACLALLAALAAASLLLNRREAAAGRTTG